jgi:hypothetical protein
MLRESTTKINSSDQTPIPDFSTNNNEIQMAESLSTTSIPISEIFENQNIEQNERTGGDSAVTAIEGYDKKRLAARERMASKRVAFTPEDVEKERAITRERMAAKRADSMPEQIEKRRAITRERMASKRLAFTPEEVEKEQAAARQRMAIRRAATAAEEINYQETVNRDILTSESAGSTDVGSNMERSASAQVGVSRTNHTSTGKKHVEMTMKRVNEKEFQVNWPEQVRHELKIKCLKNLLKEMSMNSLAEGVCGICNRHCYKRDLHCLPLNKIPSVELLTAHNDLQATLLSTQKVHGFHSEITGESTVNITSNALENHRGAG